MRRRPPGVLYRTDIDPPAAVPPSPVVAREAARLGVGLGTVRGRGVGGRVRLADLVPSSPAPVATPRAVAVTEADVTGLVTSSSEPGELLARAAAALLAAEAGPVPGGLSVTAPDARGGLVAVAVPDATELSVPGLRRAIARARSEPAPSGGGLAVHDAGDDGLLLELPVVDPEPALLLAVGAPRRELAPYGPDGALAVAVRWTVRLAAVSDPARVPRGAATALLRAVAGDLEQGR